MYLKIRYFKNDPLEWGHICLSPEKLLLIPDFKQIKNWKN
jgi:hypothetical protein